MVHSTDQKRPSPSWLYRNIPNAVSILGILPLSLLVLPFGFSLFPALVLFNNFMDDLDGILARYLDLRSPFGARLDNLCDAVGHIAIVVAVGGHYGGLVLVAAQLPCAAILVRMTRRMDLDAASEGSTTNELMRHLFFLVLFERIFSVAIEPWLIAVLLFHGVTLVLRVPFPYLLRTLATTVPSVLGINLVLLVAWQLPSALPWISAGFFATYLISAGAGLQRFRRS